MRKWIYLTILSLLLFAAPNYAQSTVQLASRSFGGAQNGNPGAATIDAAGESVVADDTRGLATMYIQTVGTFSGGFEFQCSVDGTNYKQVDVTPISSQTPQTVMSTENVFVASVSGRKCRVIEDPNGAWTSGSAVISMLGLFSAGGGGGGGSGGEVTNAGAFAVQESGAALTALQLIDNAVSGAGFNITQEGGVAVSLNTGTVDTGTRRVVEASNSDLMTATNLINTNLSTANGHLNTLATNIGQDASINVAIPGSGPLVTAETATLGTSPTAYGANGRAGVPKISLNGVSFVNLVTPDLLRSPITREDTASADLDGLLVGACQTQATAATTSVTDGDYEALKCDRAGNSRVIEAGLAAQMVADGAATAGNPVYVGGLSTSSITGQTPVSTAQRIGFVGGLDRVQIVRPYANLEDRVTATPVGITDGSSTSVISAQGAGVRFCLTSAIVSNSSATNVTVDLRDGTAGAVLATIPAAANMGGAAPTFPVPICTTANTALAADPSAAATTVTVTAVGFKSEL